MNLAQTIYERSLRLPEAAAREALDFIDFLGQRYGSTPAQAVPSHLSATQAFLTAVAGSWGADVADDVAAQDLGVDVQRESL